MDVGGLSSPGPLERTTRIDARHCPLLRTFEVVLLIGIADYFDSENSYRSGGREPGPVMHTVKV